MVSGRNYAVTINGFHVLSSEFQVFDTASDLPCPPCEDPDWGAGVIAIARVAVLFWFFKAIIGTGGHRHSKQHIIGPLMIPAFWGGLQMSKRR